MRTKNLWLFCVTITAFLLVNLCGAEARPRTTSDESADTEARRLCRQLDALAQGEGSAASVRILLNDVMRFGKAWPEAGGQVLLELHPLMSELAGWGIESDEELVIINTLSRSPNANLRRLAAARLELIEMGERPLNLAMVDINGASLDLAKLRGKIVLVVFWATWCGSCVREIERLHDLYERYRTAGLEIVGLACQAEADRTKVEAMVSKYGMTWPQALVGEGSNRLAAVEPFGIRSIPAIFLFDRSGLLVFNTSRGGASAHARLERAVEHQLMAK